ncbi:hypothetical protein D3C73_1183280 [compost metagenome]
MKLNPEMIMILAMRLNINVKATTMISFAINTLFRLTGYMNRTVIVLLLNSSMISLDKSTEAKIINVTVVMTFVRLKMSL